MLRKVTSHGYQNRLKGKQPATVITNAFKLFMYYYLYIKSGAFEHFLKFYAAPERLELGSTTDNNEGYTATIRAAVREGEQHKLHTSQLL